MTQTLLAGIDSSTQSTKVLLVRAQDGVGGPTSSGALQSAGTGDNAGAALGLDLRTGGVLVSIGTSGTRFGISETPGSDAIGIVSDFADATGCYLPQVCTVNATRVLSTVEALPGVDHDEFASLARSGPAGANGLTLLPYLAVQRIAPAIFGRPVEVPAAAEYVALVSHGKTLGH
jgi:xylulokinase